MYRRGYQTKLCVRSMIIVGRPNESLELIDLSLDYSGNIKTRSATTTSQHLRKQLKKVGQMFV